ncbi:MAG: M14 family metallopeptidase [Leucothrix sp.]
MISINQAFDAGNIEVIAAASANAIQLRIRPDTHADFFQWFYFRVSGARQTPLSMTIVNAEQAAFVGGWEAYEALASYDQQEWFRVPTAYTDGKLVIAHEPECDSVYYAYFTPYSLARHQQFVGQMQCDTLCNLEVVGQSLQGRDLDVLRIGEDDGTKSRVWVIARQHPGESMAEWFVEGLLKRLVDRDDALAETLLSKHVFYIVPNMNPDGSTLGNLRTNAAGVNLNRVWGKADTETCPEVYYVQQKIEATGCDLFLDIHGDETLPWNFIAGQKGLPVAASILQQEADFQAHYEQINPDFQRVHGYPAKKFGGESLTLASNWVGDRFGIASMTLEMPFKDNAGRPDPECGWSAERSTQLGASILYPIFKHFDALGNA